MQLNSSWIGLHARITAASVVALGIGVIVALAGTPALAADILFKAPPPPPPPPIWTGCYIGGNVGAALGRSDWSDVVPQPVEFGPNNFIGTNPAHPISNFYGGVIGGGQVGCNYQVSPQWVLGIEGMYDGTDMHGNVTAPNMYNTPVTALGVFGSSNGILNTSQNYIASLTGRVGYTWQDMMIYGKGGVAWTQYNYHVSNSCFDNVLFVFCGNALVQAQTGDGQEWDGSRTVAGGTAGLGIEWHFAPHVTAFAEYDYYGFGSANIRFPLTHCGSDELIPNICPVPNAKNAQIANDVQTVKFGVNYLFNFGCCGPLVTKD